MLTTEARKELHSVYMEHSEAYQGLFAAFGPTLSIDFADRMAFTHGTTLRALELEDPNVANKSRVNLLEFMLTLGY